MRVVPPQLEEVRQMYVRRTPVALDEQVDVVRQWCGAEKKTMESLQAQRYITTGKLGGGRCLRSNDLSTTYVIKFVTYFAVFPARLLFNSSSCCPPTPVFLTRPT